ncbi:MAG: alkaline phosphatase D family protein [Thermoleophilaceae bacterium]
MGDARQQPPGDGSGLTRRQLLAAGAATGAAAALGAGPAFAAEHSLHLDFSQLPDTDGWGPAWTTVGVANLRREGGEGVLVAGSDVFPTDPRPVAFALDWRVRDAAIRAVLTDPGLAPGVVLRRVAPGVYYAAVYDTNSRLLTIVRRTGARSPAEPVTRLVEELHALASVPALLAEPPLTLALEAHGAGPTKLSAELVDRRGRAYRAEAVDDTPELQARGDPGVLATSSTFLGSDEETLSPLGSRRALFGLQETAALLETPAGEAYLDLVERRSTARFREIAVSSSQQPRVTAPSVLAATSGRPVAGGAVLHVASDVPADAVIDLSHDPEFGDVRTVAAGATGDFDAVTAEVGGLEPGQRVHWRARLVRRGRERSGPVRSFRVPPAPGDPGRVALAIAACGTEFGPIFDRIAEREPDVFVWQGDLNYPDTAGQLAQTMSGYGGIWRDFLRNPRLEPILARTCFAPQRDDHDYGLQDYNSSTDVPWGIAPWEALMAGGTYSRFASGLVEVWVLDQRRFKSLPTLPDTPEKSLLGEVQRSWLLETLAASTAPFKVICSPCTLHYGDNSRDGNWGNGFTAERDLLLGHVAEHVSGRTIFVTGDTHDTMVYDRDGVFEVRACPVDIPVTRDHPGVIGIGGTPGEGFLGDGVVYANLDRHFCVVEAEGDGDRARMDVTLVQERGGTPYTKRFELPFG